MRAQAVRADVFDGGVSLQVRRLGVCSLEREFDVFVGGYLPASRRALGHAWAAQHMKERVVPQRCDYRRCDMRIYIKTRSPYLCRTYGRPTCIHTFFAPLAR